MNIADIHFLNPNFIWISILLSTICVYLYVGAENKQSLQTVASDDMKKVFGIGVLGKILKILLLWSIWVCIWYIMAHPYKLWSDIEVKKDGIDIIIAIDISGSMDFTDFEPSRLEVAKSTIMDFVWEVISDRIGLIVFAGKPISSQPLTFDYEIINETVASLSTEILNQRIAGLSGTNIGDALLLSKNVFTETPLSSEGEGLGLRSKVVILITDGDANSGADPALVAQLLKKDGITVYSIWIWQDKETQVKVNNGFFQQIQSIPPLNSAILESVSKKTNGVFFRAGNSDTLKQIFNKLKELQTSEITTNVTQYKIDYYTPFVYLLLLLLWLLSFIELIHPKCK